MSQHDPGGLGATRPWCRATVKLPVCLLSAYGTGGLERQSPSPPPAPRAVPATGCGCCLSRGPHRCPRWRSHAGSSGESSPWAARPAHGGTRRRDRYTPDCPPSTISGRAWGYSERRPGPGEGVAGKVCISPPTFCHEKFQTHGKWKCRSVNTCEPAPWTQG